MLLWASEFCLLRVMIVKYPESMVLLWFLWFFNTNALPWGFIGGCDGKDSDGNLWYCSKHPSYYLKWAPLSLFSSGRNPLVFSWQRHPTDSDPWIYHVSCRLAWCALCQWLVTDRRNIRLHFVIKSSYSYWGWTTCSYPVYFYLLVLQMQYPPGFLILFLTSVHAPWMVMWVVGSLLMGFESTSGYYGPQCPPS